ncbi:MAG: hypothetical protein K8F92_14990 [Hyphomicrobium sp.]|uniref:hypothetical protein n=1 Tax=Hyphomicrobium sp. TaxID=82 RepID=UPI001325D003|nr:hypothetical protein [Hyphomicrobium sp.]KAB2941049.1 MAG: hypothetical protein F9K20_10815 [Hyphomicrobium sp.]MBZ0210938.1 hypothetical protein [Hyphomicrobium sp.]MCZ7595934.1 hypothetical protein [Hyphomicrobium sp.]
MFWRAIPAPVVALLVAASFIGAASAQPRDRDRGFDRGRGDNWQLLGSTRVGGRGIDHDVVDVGRREGRFENIALAVRGGPVFIAEVIVVYGNNDVQRFDVRRGLRDGERTPPLNLQGRDRAIRQIEIVARGRRDPRMRAVVDVFGEERRGGRDAWELLGEQSVGFGVDRDVIRVGRREGFFSKIALEVRDNDVEILDLRVFFERGPPQDVRVREFIRAGGRTRAIDLIGRERLIDRIEIVYRSRPGFRGRAKVAIFGLRDFAPPPPPPMSWVELGCGKVGIKPDRDTIRVGRREGRFSAIKLAVRGSKIELIDLTVVYDRGPPDELRVRKKIGDGDETPPLDLRGERRAIDRVDLTYRQTLGLNMIKGPATVCVLGR